MNKVLLAGSNFIKSATNISDNISEKLIHPAVLSAQEEGLRTILGDRLMDKLLNMVETSTITGKYRTLLDKCQWYLAYQVVSDIVMLTAVKIDNAGNQQVSDEKMDPLSVDDSFRLQQFYLSKADFYAQRIQDYLLNNYSDFSELTENQIHSIKSNLHSSANTGLWLGGARGRILEPETYLYK